jgi:hypothetical protein
MRPGTAACTTLNQPVGANNVPDADGDCDEGGGTGAIVLNIRIDD